MGYAFISYSSKQQKYADSLRHLLQNNGIDTWMAPYDIPDDTEYADVINDAIQDAACFVLLLTEDAQNSIYVDKEIERALHYGKTIAPIQLDSSVLNDSFSFYLCNQQIIMVSTIDASVPKIQKMLQHLRFLCNGQLAQKEASVDATRDKRTRRKRISRLFMWSGVVLLCISLFCGYQHVNMSSRVTFMELYGAEYIPTLSELAWSFVIFFSLAFAAVLACLYGYALRDPQKKTWNIFRIVHPRQIMSAFSVLCGAGFGLMCFAQQSVAEIVSGLEVYGDPTVEYLLPQWVMPMTWILAFVCIGTALLSLVLAFVHDKRNGFAFAKNLRGKFLMITTHWKRGGR